MNNNLKETKVEIPIVCLDGRTNRYERRQIKVAIAKLLSKQNPKNETLALTRYLLAEACRCSPPPCLARLLGPPSGMYACMGLYPDDGRWRRPAPGPGRSLGNQFLGLDYLDRFLGATVETAAPLYLSWFAWETIHVHALMAGAHLEGSK